MAARKFALASLWSLYRDGVFGLTSEGSCFNPYRDEVESLDCPGAARIRRQNLMNFLTAYPDMPNILLIGEAPGPWGCRFSGVLFTSERQLEQGAVPFKGRRTSANGLPHSERSASIFWSALTPHFPRFMIWSTVPYLPHQPGNPLSIRTPKPAEVRAHLSLMEAVLDIVRPETTLAVGRLAQGALTQLDRPFMPIRHPSHGGATEFRNGIQRAFRGLAVK